MSALAEMTGGLEAIWAVLVAVIYAGACFGFGSRLSALVQRGDRATDPVEKATAFLIGVFGLGAALIGVGLVGALQPMVIWGIVALCYAVSVPLWQATASCRSALAAAKQLWHTASLSERALGVAVVLLTFAYGAAALVKPPIGDAEAFYMNYAQLIAAQGRLIPMPGAFEFFSTISLPGELHFAALINLAGQGAAKLFVMPVAGVAALYLMRICQTCGGGRLAQLVTLIVLLSSSSFTHYAIDGKVDLFAAAFGLAAVYWALEATRAPERSSSLVWVGLMTGAATMAKFSYLPTLLPALLVILIWRNFDGRYSGFSVAAWATAREALVAAAWAALPWLPHLAKNAVLFDAPLAPFIGGPQDTAWLNQVWFSPETTRWILATYPFALVFGRYPMQGGGLSFVLLACAPLAWLVWRQISGDKTLLRRLLLACLLGVAIWMILRPSVIAPRYFLATILLIVPLIAIATERALQSLPWGGVGVLRLGTLVVLWAALASSSWHVLPTLRALPAYASGKLERCAMASAYCVPQQHLARTAAEGERIYVAGYYSYWLRPDQILCSNTPAEARTAAQSADPVADLQKLGFRHLVIDETSNGWMLESVRQSPDAELVMQSGIIHLFALPSTSVDAPACEGLASRGGARQ